MANITGGRVVFARTVQPAQYESARAEAELSFVLEEGEDSAKVLAELGTAVKAAALDLVGQRGRGEELAEQPTSGRRFRRRDEEVAEQPSAPARGRFRRRDIKDDRDDEIPF